jgi:hypothetical protein
MGMQQQWEKIVRGKFVIAAEVRWVNVHDMEDEGSSSTLRRGFGQSELAAFVERLEMLDNEYLQITWGAIWFTDGSWAVRVHDQWGGYWSLQSVLQIPEYLK